MIKMFKQLKNKSGFTMIEMIAVLVMIGILSAIAIVRISSTSSSADFKSQLEAIKGHLRYAQMRALDTDGIWGINFTSATTYYLFHGDGSTAPVMLPGESNATVNLTQKKSALTITPPAGGRVTFDADGSPGATNITVGTSGGDITVTRNTGFIP